MRHLPPGVLNHYLTHANLLSSQPNTRTQTHTDTQIIIIFFKNSARRVKAALLSVRQRRREESGGTGAYGRETLKGQRGEDLSQLSDEVSRRG